MAPVSPGDASLINDVQFLEELAQLERTDELAADSVPESRVYADAIQGFDVLEEGLPTNAVPPETDARRREPALIVRQYAPDPEDPRPVENRISLTAAGIVLLACLTLGAATAALVFHDRVTSVTALRPATR